MVKFVQIISPKMLKSTREESCRKLSDSVRTGNQNFFFQNAPTLLFPAGTQMCRQQQKRHPFGCPFVVGARNGTFSRGRTRQCRYRSVRSALTTHRGVIDRARTRPGGEVFARRAGHSLQRTPFVISAYDCVAFFRARTPPGVRKLPAPWRSLFLMMASTANAVLF